MNKPLRSTFLHALLFCLSLALPSVAQTQSNTDRVLSPAETRRGCDDSTPFGKLKCWIRDTPSYCGDGIIDVGEACDDGNNNNNDSCTAACAFNICGDGYVEAGIEDCDDGNLEDEDDCSNDCSSPRLVFLTSEWTDGANFGGVAGADAICNDLAFQQANLQGKKFKAWISDAKLTNSPVARIKDLKFKGWYKLINGNLIARGWDDLITADPMGNFLLHAINQTETGFETNGSNVWTNTKPSGVPEFIGAVDNCNNWTSSSIELKGAIGKAKPSTINKDWTSLQLMTCGGSNRLYCFEVP